MIYLPIHSEGYEYIKPLLIIISNFIIIFLFNFRILYRIDEADPSRANFVYEKTFSYSAMSGKCKNFECPRTISLLDKRLLPEGRSS